VCEWIYREEVLSPMRLDQNFYSTREGSGKVSEGSEEGPRKVAGNFAVEGP
jgi:hypothetical protein